MIKILCIVLLCLGGAWESFCDHRSDVIPKQIKKKMSLNPMPMVKKFLIKVKNQKLIISNESHRGLIKGFGTDWNHDTSSIIALKKNDGVKFGAFLHDKTMVYLRAGFETNPVRLTSKSPWDTSGLARITARRHLSPGLGVEWMYEKNLSISGEIRASVPTKTLKQDALSKSPKDKITSALLLQARYKIGTDSSNKIPRKKAPR